MAATPDTIPLTCRVSPNARRTEFSGWTMDEKGRPVLLVKLHAVPVEGAANIELLRFLAELLDCGKNQVTLVRGSTSRLKVVEIPAALESRLPPDPDQCLIVAWIRLEENETQSEKGLCCDPFSIDFLYRNGSLHQTV